MNMIFVLSFSALVSDNHVLSFDLLIADSLSLAFLSLYLRCNIILFINHVIDGNPCWYLDCSCGKIT